MRFVHFADDIAVFASDSDINNVHASVNRELVGVDNWLKFNRLSLNVSKTSYMIISNQKNALDITIRETLNNNTIIHFMKQDYKIYNWHSNKNTDASVNRFASNTVILNQAHRVAWLMGQKKILTKVSTVKFLGVTLDENLTFQDHVNKVTSNISKFVGVMRRLHCQLPANVMVILYYSLVYSHLTYALLAWGRSGSTNAAKIE